MNQIQKEFWGHFIGENLLPPMKFKELAEEIEFKSFNTNFMIWLFSHTGSNELYDLFYSDQSDEVLEIFTSKYDICHDEVSQLINYLKNISNIFSSLKEEEKQSVVCEEEMKSVKMNDNVNYVDSKTNSMVNMALNNISKIEIDIFSTERKINDWKMENEFEYNKLFNTSFEYDKDYMFHEE